MSDGIEAELITISKTLIAIRNEQPSLRDYFAAHAMAFYLENTAAGEDAVAINAYSMADAMLAHANE